MDRIRPFRRIGRADGVSFAQRALSQTGVRQNLFVQFSLSFAQIFNGSALWPGRFKRCNSRSSGVGIVTLTGASHSLASSDPSSGRHARALPSVERYGSKLFVHGLCLANSYYVYKSPLFHRLVNPGGNGTIWVHA